MATVGTRYQASDSPGLNVLNVESPAIHTVPRVLGIRRWLFVLSDLAGICAGALLVTALRFPQQAIHPKHAPLALPIHVGVVCLYSVLVVLFSHALGLYAPHQTASSRRELVTVLKAVFLASMVITASVYAAGLKDVSRFVIVAVAALSGVTMAGWRQLRRQALARAVADGLSCQNVLIIGTDSLAQALRDQLESQRQLGFVVRGMLHTGESFSRHKPSPGANVIGTLADLPRICRTKFIDEIVICAQSRNVVKSVIEHAQEYGVGVRVIPDLYDGLAWGAHLDYLGAFPTLAIVHREVRSIELKLKRLLDIIGSVVGLLLLSPVLVAIALAVKLDSRGPVFYISQRVGRKGRTFACYKFRTMISDAEKRKAELGHLNERDGILFKISNDPRITRVGRILRKYSLDELAQLWNVLKGDMSLVGPRPPLASEVKQYELDYYRRLEAAPGITGLWQVEARTSPSFQEYISLDLRYVKNWSLALDFKILFRTVAVVIAGTGS